MKDYYDILQVSPSAEPEVIEAAYKRLARKYHPDVDRDPAATERMRDLNEAYEMLSDPAGRAEYDLHRSRGASVSDYSTGEGPVETSVVHGSPGNIRRTFFFWLRWLAVLPAGILSVILVSFPVHWAVLIFTGLAGNDESFGLWDLPPETLERLGQAFFAPFAFVGLGARTAPAYRFKTAGLLVILWAMALGAAMTYAGNQGAYSGWGWAEFAAASGLGVAGMIAGIYWIYERDGVS